MRGNSSPKIGPLLPLLLGLVFAALVVGLGLLAEGLDEGWWG